MKKVKLTQGKFAFVDDEDYEKISKYNWYVTHFGYACRKTRKSEREKGLPSVTYMHRQLMGSENGKDVDHIDGNKLNNQKSNLRICSRSENLRNQRTKSSNKSSLYKGVSWVKERKKWRSYIYYDKKVHYLGMFESEKEAALTYNKAASKHHGEYACVNKIIS